MLQFFMRWRNLSGSVFGQPDADASHKPEMFQAAYEDGFTAGAMMGSKAEALARVGGARAAFLRGFEDGKALYENSW
ncbi:hypothetical protein HN018_19520 [Lichenicola cladoniae]|uniref:Uncharacterized protein n=1 Tax=Lichenicola cladoniae TaxID=1484109 RepID=A0A6M8HTS8_9PROT|nr:hypothetical protein [Lichenicola cladoniae]NPD66051.1 hypothetical protein [Acetobacteraceae bacterium]QKE91929.1 hypothetical protein HN018_19520 [Lichenicola cladoniae]